MALSSSLDATADGDGVRFVYTVTNDGEEPVKLSFRSGQSFDVLVDEGGDERWRYSDGRMFTQVLRSETLEPGETKRYETTWEDPPAGDYQARAVLDRPDRSCEARTTVSVD
ncbi:BsuPI-related putative proteinase inhibitor [Natronorarus salvus]|uniref:BsuPI-related putative proteinase inhibitor n=1 Tax=Natronorarus salvus TaxID=3117733 RepID=UPI002F263729